MAQTAQNLHGLTLSMRSRHFQYAIANYDVSGQETLKYQITHTVTHTHSELLSRRGGVTTAL